MTTWDRSVMFSAHKPEQSQRDQGPTFFMAFLLDFLAFLAFIERRRIAIVGGLLKLLPWERSCKPVTICGSRPRWFR